MSVVDRSDLDPERLWTAAVGGLAAVLVAGSLAFPTAVYDRFVWQYFWGPVQADAHAATCAVRAVGATGGTRYLTSADACAAATGVVAVPGYTLVSEVGYAVLLLLALGGVVLLLDRLAIGTDRRFFYALTPFVFFGGALRVVEDATDAGPGVESVLAYPLNVPVISPFIYVTVFVVTLAAVLAAVGARRRGLVDDYARPLAGLGVAVLLATLSVLVALGTGAAPRVSFHPQVFVAIVTVATAVAAATYLLVDRVAPEVNAGTGLAGAVVIWGHAIDGTANVIGLEWLVALGAGPNLVAKHPLNRLIVEGTASILPPGVEATIGSAWSFLLVKLAVATLVVWAFDDRTATDHPRYTVLLLVAVLAVGLGPGTRDMLRATLGV
jgi:uncharacterized membrane protein